VSTASLIPPFCLSIPADSAEMTLGPSACRESVALQGKTAHPGGQYCDSSVDTEQAF